MRCNGIPPCTDEYDAGNRQRGRPARWLFTRRRLKCQRRKKRRPCIQSARADHPHTDGCRCQRRSGCPACRRRPPRGLHSKRALEAFPLPDLCPFIQEPLAVESAPRAFEDGARCRDRVWRRCSSGYSWSGQGSFVHCHRNTSFGSRRSPRSRRRRHRLSLLVIDLLHPTVNEIARRWLRLFECGIDRQRLTGWTRNHLGDGLAYPLGALSTLRIVCNCLGLQ
jgi:hypothetical protein